MTRRIGDEWAGRDITGATATLERRGEAAARLGSMSAWPFGVAGCSPARHQCEPAVRVASPGAGKRPDHRQSICPVEVAEEPATPDSGEEVRPTRRRKATRTLGTIEIDL